MKVLFLHQNFPAQFRQIADYLAQDSNNELLAFKQPPASEYPGVGIIAYRFLHEPDPAIHPLLTETEAKVLRGEAVAEAARRLKGLGWDPDVIVAHPGWGEALFVREIWPDVRLVMYCEYYYRSSGQDFGFDPEFPEHDVAVMQRLKLKNTVMLQALGDADLLWSPTEWQRNTFPDWIRPRIQVLHEGVDTEYFRPDANVEFQIANKGVTLRSGDPVITFAARGLEPVRGFHIFMRALPDILKQCPDAQVVIMGAEAAAYGAAPQDYASWQQKLLSEVGDQLDPQRVHLVGFLPTEAYRAVLQVSRVHVYLTYPFFLSWSVLEAMACGALIVASDTGPVREVIRHGENGFLVPFFDNGKLVELVAKQLKSKPKAVQSLRDQARALVCREFSMDACMRAMMAALPAPQSKAALAKPSQRKTGKPPG